MAYLRQKVEINIAAVPVRGFGGLCMVITSLICVAALPATRWFMLAAIGAGIVFAVGLIVLRRRAEPGGPTHGGTLLGLEASSRPESQRAPTVFGRLRAANLMP